MAEMTIDNTDIAEYGARLLSYTVGGTELTNTIGVSQFTDFPTLFQTDYGRRNLTFTLVFRPSFRPGEKLTVPNKLYRLTDQKNRLNMLLCSGSTVEIALPDKFLYNGVLETIGEEILDGESLEVTYQLTCVRHGKLETEEGSTIYCHSTALRTNCCIFVYVGNDWTDGEMLVLQSRSTVYVYDVSPGDTIEINGIKRYIYRNGANIFGTAGITTFPYLRPGKNTHACINHPNASITYRTLYYPTFV